MKPGRKSFVSQGTHIYRQQVRIILDRTLGKASLPSQSSIIDEIVNSQSKRLHFGKKRSCSLGLRQILHQDPYRDGILLLQLSFERKQEFLTTCHKDQVTAIGGVHTRIGFTESAGSTRDEGCLRLVHCRNIYKGSTPTERSQSGCSLILSEKATCWQLSRDDA